MGEWRWQGESRGEDVNVQISKCSQGKRDRNLARGCSNEIQDIFGGIEREAAVKNRERKERNGMNWKESVILSAASVKAAMQMMDKSALQIAFVIDEENRLFGALTDKYEYHF